MIREFVSFLKARLRIAVCPRGAGHRLCDFPGLQFSSCEESASAMTFFSVNAATLLPFIKTVSQALFWACSLGDSEVCHL